MSSPSDAGSTPTESEVIRNAAAGAGIADAVVVNTCAVTAEAVRQARQSIRRLKRERPDAKIVVTGCAAQTEPQTFARMREIALVVGNDRKLDAAFWTGQRSALDRRRSGSTREEKVRVNDIMAVRETAAAPDRRHRRARARVHPDAERLRSPLHLLHHPLWPRELALGPDGRGGRAGAQARRERLPRGGADRRRHHELWREPAGRARGSGRWCGRS